MRDIATFGTGVLDGEGGRISGDGRAAIVRQDVATEPRSRQAVAVVGENLRERVFARDGEFVFAHCNDLLRSGALASWGCPRSLFIGAFQHEVWARAGGDVLVARPESGVEGRRGQGAAPEGRGRSAEVLEVNELVVGGRGCEQV